jgi:hypothetical protein
MLRRITLLAIAGATAFGVACASTPDAPSPGRSDVFGEVRLVPREGVEPGGAGPRAYGDRRLGEVDFVDYSRPGFAVVYSEGAPPAGRVELRIESSAVRTRLSPSHAALGSEGTIAVRNDSDADHVVSFPAARLVSRIAPGGTLEIPVPSPGELHLFLLDAPGAEALLFAAPGPFTVASRSGSYALHDLAPGGRALRVWHPRFPPASRWVELPADRAVRVDLALGVQVGQDDSGGDDDEVR